MTHAEEMQQAELARRLGARLRRDYDRSMVNKMLLGRREVSAEEMLAIEEITGYRAPVEAASKQALVPVLDMVSAGKLADLSTQIPAEDVPLVAFADLGPGDFFALRVVGDSMDRISPEGSLIVVNRADRDLVAERPYVFSLRGEATYKLWQPRPPHLAPHSWNAANKPIFLKGMKGLEVVGRVRRTVLDL